MKTFSVNDKMQRGYIHKIIEPIVKNVDSQFIRELAPKEMIELGVFEGKYYNDGKREFSNDWFVCKKVSDTKDGNLNFFSVNASQPLSERVKKGWINPQGPRGWFQWNCRYFIGRRTPEEDQRQIKRWSAFRRHAGAIKKYCEPYDFQCRKKQRQALLHWAYDARQL